MSNDTLVLTPAADVLPGDRLDLEGDRYATMTGHGGRDPATPDRESTISAFEFEYAVVDSVERETEDCIVLHTSLTSFACPPDYRLRRRQFDEIWIIGVIETCKRLGRFPDHDEAAEFISTLPDHEQGIYYLDGPCDPEA